MAPKGKGENTKKVAGNAKKAEAAAQKKAADESQKAAVESQEWQKGAKDSSKAYATLQSHYYRTQYTDTYAAKQQPRKQQTQHERRQRRMPC